MDNKTSNETSEKRVVPNDNHHCEKEIIKEMLNDIVDKICLKSNDGTETKIEVNSQKEVKKNIYFGGELVKFSPKSNQKDKSMINTKLADEADENLIDQNDEKKNKSIWTTIQSPVTKDSDSDNLDIQKWDYEINPKHVIEEDNCEIVITNIGKIVRKGDQRGLPKNKDMQTFTNI